MDLSSGYAVVDLETTGLDCWDDLIIEIGVSVVRPGAQPDTDSVLVSIDRPLPAEIINLTGITDLDLRTRGKTIDEALAWFVDKTKGLPLVGHNIIRFDRAFLLEAARVHRRSAEEGSFPRRVIDEVDDLPAWRFIDTAGLFKGYKMGVFPSPGESHRDYVHRVLDMRTPPGLRYSLAVACNEFGISTARVRAHRAHGDVVQNQKLFEKLLEFNPPE